MTPAERFPWATILPFEGKWPEIHETAFVAPGARIIGDVTLGPQSSVWYNCVLRGDIHRIVVGARSNVQDGSVFHVEGPRPDTDGCPTIIGEDCVIGLVKVRARAKDGEANEAVLALLADALGVPTSRLHLLRGATGRDKVVRLD